MMVGQPAASLCPFQVWAGSGAGQARWRAQSPWVGGSSPAEPSASTDLPAGGPHAPSKAHPKGRPAGLLIKKAHTPCLLAEASLEGPGAAGGCPGAQAGGGDAGRASLLWLLRPRAVCQVPAGFSLEQSPRGQGIWYLATGGGFCHEVASISSSPLFYSSFHFTTGPEPPGRMKCLRLSHFFMTSFCSLLFIENTWISQ